jgi:hypothetical protein
MLNKVISALENLQEVKFNSIYRTQVMAEATEMFNAGWDALEDGIVVLTKGNLVAVKKGNSIVKYEMADFSVNLGKLSGNIARTIEEKEVTEALKETYLAQTIITKYYTLRRA